MYTIIVALHIIVCIGLILIVLLQAGKSSGMAGLFGGGSDQVFDAPSGLAFIKKITVIMAVVFMITALSLTVFTSRSGMKSVVDQIPYIPVTQPQSPVQQGK